MAQRLTETYQSTITTVDGAKREVIPSSILVTKILLGTFGCIPAYDRYVIEGLAECGIHPYSFGKKSYSALLQFCRDHADELGALDIRTRSGKERYPGMKLLDMYFWVVGYHALERQTLGQAK